MFNCFASILITSVALSACSSLPDIDSSLELQTNKTNTVMSVVSFKDFLNLEHRFYTDSEYYQSSPNSLTAAQCGIHLEPSQRPSNAPSQSLQIP